MMMMVVVSLQIVEVFVAYAVAYVVDAVDGAAAVVVVDDAGVRMRCDDVVVPY